MHLKLETEEEKKFVKHVHKRLCRAYKLAWTKKGWPDQTVILPGARVVFFEFKRGNNQQSPHQDKVKKVLVSYGFDWHTPYTAIEAIKIFNAYLDTP